MYNEAEARRADGFRAHRHVVAASLAGINHIEGAYGEGNQAPGAARRERTFEARSMHVRCMLNLGGMGVEKPPASSPATVWSSKFHRSENLRE